MRTLQADDGVEIAYRVTGPGPLSLLLVHGWMLSGEVFDALVEALDKSGLRIIVPDLRGTGRSGKPQAGYDLGRHARDMLCLADAECPEPFVIVGHSMGGQIAQLLAAEQPQRIAGLCLICTVPASGIALPDDARALFRGSAGNRDMQRTILRLACRQLSEETEARLLNIAAPIPAACIAEGFDAWSRGGFADRLGAITAPTVAIGTDDPFLPPELLRSTVTSKIRGARLALLPGPGHYPQVERPRETAALLESFLAGLRPGGRALAG